jgi:SAM-dependent methyltransferase
MADHDEYFEYLNRRSQLGAFYRTHWLYPKLSRRLVGKVLDIGCGIGDMLLFRPGTVGVDVNSRTVELCRARGATAITMVADKLPFDDAQFDSALMDNVLEHIEDPAAILADAKRVIRAGGRLLVGVPGSKGWLHDPDHKVRYDASLLVKTVVAAGFVHEETFHTPLWKSDWLDDNLKQYCIYCSFTSRK